MFRHKRLENTVLKKRNIFKFTKVSWAKVLKTKTGDMVGGAALRSGLQSAGADAWLCRAAGHVNVIHASALPPFAFISMRRCFNLSSAQA